MQQQGCGNLVVESFAAIVEPKRLALAVAASVVPTLNCSDD